MATRKSKKTRKVETTYAKGGAVAKRASKIYESWKEDYKDAFRTAHGDTKKAARKNTAAKQTLMF